MKFPNDPTTISEIRNIICECFLGKDTTNRVAMLTILTLNNYIKKLKIDATLDNFINQLYALFILQYEKQSLLIDTDLIKFLELIKVYKFYKNEDDKQEIEQLIAKLKETETDLPSDLAPPIDPHEEAVNLILDCLKNGTLVPILGRNINLCGRSTSDTWTPESSYPPTTRELAQYLTKNCPFSHSITEITPEEEVRCSLRKLRSSEGKGLVILTEPNSNQKLAVEVDLPYLSECVTLHGGSDAIYNQLRSLFQRSFNPTPLHTFLAELPKKLKNRGFYHSYPLILTTNYDDVLERTFDREQECYNTLSYIAKGKYQGRFRHRSSKDRKGKVIKTPNLYSSCDTSQQSVILKIHGALDWSDGETRRDGFVITEDHYINYLAHADVFNSIPAIIREKLTSSNLLFLGYDLSDWCMRAILHCIWKEQPLNYPEYKSWVVPVGSRKLNRQLWQGRNADILNISLEEFITKLNQRL